MERTAASWRELVFGKNPRNTLFRVCIWTVTVNVFFHSLLLPITVSGSSMAPTYESGARNFVNRVYYMRHAPQRGDIVVIDIGGREGMIIKRIVAVPGETVAIQDGEILVNGQLLRDSHARQRIPWDKSPLVLQLNEYFVIGDNRASSVFGRVTRPQILGKVVF